MTIVGKDRSNDCARGASRSPARQRCLGPLVRFPLPCLLLLSATSVAGGRLSDARVEDTLATRGLASSLLQVACDWVGWQATFRFRSVEFAAQVEAPVSIRDGIVSVAGSAGAIAVEEVCRARDRESEFYSARRRLDYYDICRGETASLLSTLGSGHDSVLMCCGSPIPNWIYWLQGQLEPRFGPVVVETPLPMAADTDARELTLRGEFGTTGRITMTRSNTHESTRVDLRAADGTERTLSFADWRLDSRTGRSLPSIIVETFRERGELREVSVWSRVELDRESPNKLILEPGTQVLDARGESSSVGSVRTDRRMLLAEALTWDASGAVSESVPEHEVAAVSEVDPAALPPAPAPKRQLENTDEQASSATSRAIWIFVVVAFGLATAAWIVIRRRGTR